MINVHVKSMIPRLPLCLSAEVLLAPCGRTQRLGFIREPTGFEQGVYDAEKYSSKPEAVCILVHALRSIMPEGNKFDCVCPDDGIEGEIAKVRKLSCNRSELLALLAGRLRRAQGGLKVLKGLCEPQYWE